MASAHRLLAVLTTTAFALGGVLSACGDSGDAESKKTGASTTGATTKAASAAGDVTLESVLRCLNGAGLSAKRQSSLGDAPDVIGIDSASGRTVIDFATSQEEADTTASAMGSDESVLRAGLVSASLSDDDLANRDIIQGCISGTTSAATASANGAVAADGPTEEEIRSCLRGEGVPFRDSSQSDPGVIDIAHSDGGVTSIVLSENEGIAKAVEKASKPFGDTLRVKTIVVSISPAGKRYLDAIEGCITA